MRSYKKIILFFILSVLAFAVNAQTDAISGTGKSFQLDADTALVVVAVSLGLVIIMLGFVLKNSIDFYKQKIKDETAKKVFTTVIVMLLSSSCLFAQDGGIKPAEMGKDAFTSFQLLMFAIILIEFVVIFFVIRWIKFFTGIQEYNQKLNDAKAISAKVSWSKIWDKMNQFKPKEQEADIDTGHSYDGIRELDNITPPWFKAAFALSIVFAMVYMWRYHVAESAPLSVQEYQLEVEDARIKHEEYLKTQANNVDENTIKVLDAAGIDAGAIIFKNTCVACHADKGQGGVGPNLTDDYWLHGGSIVDVFKTIKYGWPDKGMKAWKDDFSPVQIAQLASFIKSLKGTNPPNPKVAQGDIYIELVTTTADSTVPNKDTIKQ